jgi:hypothetical protein
MGSEAELLHVAPECSSYLVFGAPTRMPTRHDLFRLPYKCYLPKLPGPERQVGFSICSLSIGQSRPALQRDDLANAIKAVRAGLVIMIAAMTAREMAALRAEVAAHLDVPTGNS